MCIYLVSSLKKNMKQTLKAKCFNTETELVGEDLVTFLLSTLMRKKRPPAITEDNVFMVSKKSHKERHCQWTWIYIQYSFIQLNMKSGTITVEADVVRKIYCILIYLMLFFLVQTVNSRHFLLIFVLKLRWTAFVMVGWFSVSDFISFY